MNNFYWSFDPFVDTVPNQSSSNGNFYSSNNTSTFNNPSNLFAPMMDINHFLLSPHNLSANPVFVNNTLLTSNELQSSPITTFSNGLEEGEILDSEPNDVGGPARTTTSQGPPEDKSDKSVKANGPSSVVSLELPK